MKRSMQHVYKYLEAHMCTMISDCIFRKGFRSSYLRSFLPEQKKKSLFVVFSIRRKNCIRFSQNVKSSQQCIRMWSELRVWACFHFLQIHFVCSFVGCSTRCLHRVVPQFFFLLLCCVFVFILLGLDIVIVFCSLLLSFNILRIVTFLIWKTKCTDNIWRTVDNVCMCVCLELNFLPQMASVHSMAL